ncbi:DUF982 domain-containing protein [Shinella sp. BYT-45]|uniref:DUF982 domain-containing protein n=1 Tax=Shinella sp. BYT-45 TaxID=3377377 RepID=UPI00398024FF
MAEVWATTVTIEMNDAAGTFTRIHSTREAAYYLLDHWAKARSPAYCAAVRMCAKAIRGEVSHEAAYVAFMAAVREANFALISSRRANVSDELERDIEVVLAESILAELKALWPSSS